MGGSSGLRFRIFRKYLLSGGLSVPRHTNKDRQLKWTSPRKRRTLQAALLPPSGGRVVCESSERQPGSDTPPQQINLIWRVRRRAEGANPGAAILTHGLSAYPPRTT